MARTTRGHSSAARLLLSAILAALISSCMGGRDPVIDGWPVGRVMDCNRDATCADLAAAATAGLARRDPGHPAIVTLTLHDEGRVVNEDGEQVLFTRSGSCCSVARFALADGTVRAIGVGYPGISREPSAIDYGP